MDEEMRDEKENEEEPTELPIEETDDCTIDGLVHPDHMEIPDDTEEEIDPTLHSEPIQPTIIKVSQGKRKNKPDQSCKSFLGQWLGKTSPLSLPS
jgi:hypothetical protein